MDRRRFVVLSGAAFALSDRLLAQDSKRVYRIATLDDAVEKARRHSWQRFRNRLAELGYVEGRNLRTEARYADGDTGRLPGLVAELAAQKPDVLVATGTLAAGAAVKAKLSLPLVFIGVGDPVRAGIVASLARPGGNATGTSMMSSDVVGKQLELLREIAPGAKRIAYLSDFSIKSAEQSLRNLQETAQRMSLAVQPFDVRERASLDRALQALRRERIDGLIVGMPGPLVEHRHHIVQHTASTRLPTVYARREYVDAGGLASYGPDTQFIYARSADYVHRVLQGAKPADLPVEQPNKQHLVINLVTSRTLGIAIPASLKVRADEVIE